MNHSHLSQALPQLALATLTQAQHEALLEYCALCIKLFLVFIWLILTKTINHLSSLCPITLSVGPIFTFFLFWLIGPTEAS